LRALGAKQPDPELRNTDTLAGRFFGTRERRVLAEVNDPVLAGLVFDEAGPENSAPGSTIVFDYWSDPSPASPLFDRPTFSTDV
jgi:hypothetical protein